MQVFVTGASGFIGRRIVDALVEKGHQVRALCRDPSRIKSREGVEAHALDLLNLEEVLPAIKGCDAGVHAAGIGPHASEAVQQKTNVQASRHLAGAMRQARIKRLVALSSAAVLEPGDTPYRRCKIGQEAAIRAYDLELTLLRPTLVIGPWKDSLELRGLIDRLKKGKPMFVPNGGRARVQPVHVADVAAAAALAIENDGAIGKFMVVAGPEQGLTFKEFLEQARDRTGGRAAIARMPLLPMRFAASLASFVGLSAPIRAQITYYSTDHLYPLDEARALGWTPRSYDDAFADLFGG